MNKLKLIIIGVVVFILIISFIVFSIFDRRPNTSSPTIPNPTAIQFNPAQLFITSMTPPQAGPPYFPGQPVEVFFTQPVEEISLKYEIQPPTEVLINPGSTANSLILSPLTIWAIGEVKISILSQTLSTSGNALKNPQTYILKTAIPILPESAGDAY